MMISTTKLSKWSLSFYQGIILLPLLIMPCWEPLTLIGTLYFTVIPDLRITGSRWSLRTITLFHLYLMLYTTTGITSQKMMRLVTGFPSNLFTAYRKGRNLKDLLMYRDLHEVSTPPGTFTCGRSRCLTCPFVLHASTVYGPKSSFKISQSFSCTTTNVVYCIVCTKCSMLYVGEAKRRLGDRFREHLRLVRLHDMSSEVGVHFNTCGHVIHDMRVTALKSFDDDTERKRFERQTINKLGTLDPFGINRK